jgi:REP element-mobilizing transposase RayT
MAQSLARNVVHLIFSTKHRQPFVTQSVRDKLFAYLAGTLNQMRCPALQVGGGADHVHLLFVLSKTLSLSKVVEELKKESSKWAKSAIQPRFYWQTGYGAFSVSASNEKAVVDYIIHQVRHHRRMTFQQEFRKFLQKHGIEYDEQYVWD